MEGGNASALDLLKDESRFYEDAEIYWSKVEPTVNGMLGGFGRISAVDITGSQEFLRRIFSLKDRPGRGRALDCGAGIGRVTKHLLARCFQKVDLVEQNDKFIEAAKLFLSLSKNIGNYYHCGLQKFVPDKNTYDVIWCQWVLGHLTDDDLVTFFKHCSNALRENGLIIVKENVSPGEVIPDVEDSSITRNESGYREIFKKAGLEIVRHCKQHRFPKKLLLVKIFALRPTKEVKVASDPDACVPVLTTEGVKVASDPDTCGPVSTTEGVKVASDPDTCGPVPTPEGVKVASDPDTCGPVPTPEGVKVASDPDT